MYNQDISSPDVAPISRTGSVRFFGYLASAVTLLATTVIGHTAYAQTYVGTRYSSGTTSSTVYSNFAARSNVTTLTTKTTEGTHNLDGTNQNQYFGYNVSGASAGGTSAVNNGYPTGWNFSGGLTETATSGAGGSVSATFLGSTTGTDAKPLQSDTWVKGATESAGDWNVQPSSASILGGYTNANMTGNMTITLGKTYTSFGSLIGTNVGASLDVSIVGYNSTSSTPNAAVFSFSSTGITHNTSNPNFIGYSGTASFDKVVITALKTSTTAGNSTYPAYPNAAFIALDQLQVGSYQPVPAPPAAVSLGIGGMVGMLGTGVNRLRKKRKTARSAA